MISLLSTLILLPSGFSAPLAASPAGLRTGHSVHAAPVRTQESAPKRLTPKEIFQTYDDSVVTIKTDEATGTGFFLFDGTFVATCHHVIEDASEITVEGTRGGKWKVEAVYADPKTDSAILRLVEDSGRKPIPVGSYKALGPGDDLVVIGNPLGFLEHSITTGIVSAMRKVEGIDVLQMTVAISSGSSGSPVFNSEGKVVGFANASFDEGQSLNLANSVDELRRTFQKIPVPIAEFFRTAAASPAKNEVAKKETPGKEAAGKEEVSAEAAKIARATGAAVRYIDAVGREVLKWDNAYMQYMTDFADKAERNPEGTLELKHRYVLNTLKRLGELKPLAEAVGEAWSEETEAAYRKNVLALIDTATELSTAEGEVIKAVEGDKDDILEPHTAVTKLREKVRTQVYNLYGIVAEEAWFDWDQFAEEVSWPVQFAWFGIGQFDALTPDPDHEKECVIGWAWSKKGIKAGSVILGIRRTDKPGEKPVANWYEMILILEEWKDAKEFLVRYRTGTKEHTMTMAYDRF